MRAFLSSSGPSALFDLPWMPVYLFICFLFHPYIGIAALIGAAILASLTVFTEFLTRSPSRTAITHAAMRSNLADAGRRNAEAVRAMGMSGRMGSLWGDANAKYLANQQRAADVAGGLGALSKVLRFALQSLVLGIGAYLVIQQQATAGIMIASSILVSRALAPVELAIANWKAFVSARQSWRRLAELLGLLAQENEPMSLPAPRANLMVENVAAAPPGVQRIVVQDVSFMLKAGQALGVIGPSASGKSSLARLVVGVWLPARGKVRIDGAAMDQWAPNELGRHIGYLPQDVELFAGTVAQNIARYEPDAPSEAVIAAAKAAGVHDMIVRLPEGYDTQIGDSGAVLSAGQRQRVALARALYREPFLVVLDEPNSNLDAEGDKALTQAIMRVRQRGGIVIVIAHRRSALAAVDQVLALLNGKPQALGAARRGAGEAVPAAGGARRGCRSRRRHGADGRGGGRQQRRRLAPGRREHGSGIVSKQPVSRARSSIRRHLLIGIATRGVSRRRRWRLGRHHGIRRRGDRAGHAGRRFERQEGPASDRRRRRRTARARRRPREGRRHHRAPRRHADARQSSDRHQGNARASRPQGARGGRDRGARGRHVRD